MNYYQFHIGDYRRDTVHLSRLEHSIYRDLIDWYYLDELPITLDLTVVQRRLGLRSTDDERALKSVLTDFFECSTNGYVHSRIEADIEAYRQSLSAASRAGKASAAARRSKSIERAFNGRSTDVQQSFNERSTVVDDPFNQPITNNQEPVTNLSTSLCSVDTAAPAKKKRSAPKADFDPKSHLLSLGVPEQVADDFIAHRKAKRALITETALNGIHREAAKARIALSDALATCCERGWQGFKAEWYEKELGQKFGPAKSMRDLNQEAIARSLFGHLEPPIQQLPERVIDGEVL